MNLWAFSQFSSLSNIGTWGCIALPFVIKSWSYLGHFYHLIKVFKICLIFSSSYLFQLTTWCSGPYITFCVAPSTSTTQYMVQEVLRYKKCLCTKISPWLRNWVTFWRISFLYPNSFISLQNIYFLLNAFFRVLNISRSAATGGLYLFH